jgi:DNA-binding HxlR family transcriptional regulator
MSNSTKIDLTKTKIENCTKEQNGYPCFIPAQKILLLISKKWSIQLIHLLSENKNLRYNEIKIQLQKGWKKDKISDATLSARLVDFTKEGIISRDVFPETPPKVIYSLTNKGKSLSKALKHLVDWTIEICHKEGS